MKARSDIAAMLRAGATMAEVKQQLHVTNYAILATRRALNIPVPPERAKRSSAELTALEGQAVTMLRSGASYEEIRHELGFGRNRIAALRKQHRIPVQQRDLQAATRRTIDEAFARYAQPTDDGHLLWTGTRSGRGFDLTASGRTYNARAVAFRKHHGRAPEGRLRRTCVQPGCIAGAHHTDHRIRQAHQHADQAFPLIFGKQQR